MVKHRKKFVDLEEALHQFVGEMVDTAKSGPAYFLFTEEKLLEAILKQARTDDITLICGHMFLVDYHYLSAEPDEDTDDLVGAQFSEMFSRLAKKRKDLIWQIQIQEEVLVAGLPGRAP